MALFRQLSSASTQRFMASSFVKKTLASLPNDAYRDEEDRTIPVRDGEIQVRVYRPRSSFSVSCPILIMAHGGGWCLGGLDTEAFQCRLFCSSLDLVVVNVEYRLCPEFQYPVPVLDVFDATKWVGGTCLPATHGLCSQLKGVNSRSRDRWRLNQGLHALRRLWRWEPDNRSNISCSR